MLILGEPPTFNTRAIEFFSYEWEVQCSYGTVRTMHAVSKHFDWLRYDFAHYEWFQEEMS